MADQTIAIANRPASMRRRFEDHGGTASGVLDVFCRPRWFCRDEGGRASGEVGLARDSVRQRMLNRKRSVEEKCRRPFVDLDRIGLMADPMCCTACMLRLPKGAKVAVRVVPGPNGGACGHSHQALSLGD